jgi:hypothetical protein
MDLAMACPANLDTIRKVLLFNIRLIKFLTSSEKHKMFGLNTKKNNRETYFLAVVKWL